MKNNRQPYTILAYYAFTDIDNPKEEISLHNAFLNNRDITCRIYISEQGINGQLCAAASDAKEYQEWMLARPEFCNMPFKQHLHHEHVFPRRTVKYRCRLVGYDREINLAHRGQYLSPTEWKNMLEQTQKVLLFDVRNDYEWMLGHFEGATLPPCKNFREFEQYAEKLAKDYDPKTTPVMMYCTGGIRCELYSSILREKNFQEVYQLEGGIIHYGQKVGAKHWLGKLFVFDDRLSIPICEEESPVIGMCHHCKKDSEMYYNCSSMDCNTLFLCCEDCLRTYKGCCSSECQNSQRIRPLHHQHPHKPFRRKHHYQDLT